MLKALCWDGPTIEQRISKFKRAKQKLKRKLMPAINLLVEHGHFVTLEQLRDSK